MKSAIPGRGPPASRAGEFDQFLILPCRTSTGWIRRTAALDPVLETLIDPGAHNSNLPLAARRRLGHIGRYGAVAEWLKAAVC